MTNKLESSDSCAMLFFMTALKDGTFCQILSMEFACFWKKGINFSTEFYYACGFHELRLHFIATKVNIKLKRVHFDAIFWTQMPGITDNRVQVNVCVEPRFQGLFLLPLERARKEDEPWKRGWFVHLLRVWTKTTKMAECCASLYGGQNFFKTIGNYGRRQKLLTNFTVNIKWNLFSNLIRIVLW